MRAVLESREKSALVRVEELRAEFERVRTALAEAEEVLNHRVIGLEQYLEQYLEALDEQDACVDMESGGAAGAGVEEPVVAVPRRTVARKEDGVPVDVLGADYRRIVTVLGEADGSLTARQTAVALGWDTSVASRVEGARGKLKRLVERGWLVEERPGRFTLPASGSADAVAA
ncbi:hypothetical protein [Streptomyces sp. NBC_01445]|uniref:hypothetical protein n=1 Tax=Streptomyces sp. NBC_01445 TaxID=2903869 RepID=UPI002DDC155D|nr:hypothetical protein [Streptomyces sp. NBC_01445]WSE11257.1 hypothetical protein OG574_49290 [Streptomyces sp. NBC_01445]